MGNEVENEFPFCPTTTMTLVLDNGWLQRQMPNGRWRDVELMKEPLPLHGVESVNQEINSPGWRFDVKFTGDFTNSSLALSKTGWDLSESDRSVLFAKSSVDYENGYPEVILITGATDDQRILWRKWTIEMQIRRPKWRSETERQDDMWAHENMGRPRLSLHPSQEEAAKSIVTRDGDWRTELLPYRPAPGKLIYVHGSMACFQEVNKLVQAIGQGGLDIDGDMVLESLFEQRPELLEQLKQEKQRMMDDSRTTAVNLAFGQNRSRTRDVMKND
jgi:hypothetical protein